MKTTCDMETRVLEAAAAGRPSDDVLDHVASCAPCQDALAVAAWMRHLADTSGEDMRLPEAGVLLWRAELLRKADARRRAERPLAWARAASVAVALGGSAVLIASYGARIVSVAGAATPLALGAVAAAALAVLAAGATALSTR